MNRIPTKFRLYAPLVLCALTVAACSSTSTSQPSSPKSLGAECLEDLSISCANANLAGLDLSGRDLRNRTFSGAQLDGANLSGADLTGADLIGASLRSATLHKTILDGADLAVADLHTADLTQASLIGADLREAYLYGADLTGANLSGALLLRTAFSDANLSGVNGTNTVLSYTDMRGAKLDGSTWAGAVARSEDKLPATLLALGAYVCGFSTCEGTLSAQPPTTAVVPPDAFNITFLILSRFALSYAEAPTMLSRSSAISMLAGIGVYEKDPTLTIQHWTHPETELTSGLRDAAAMYAMVNTSVALRYDPLGDIRNGRLRMAATTRDVMLWQLTRSNPSARASIAHAATQSTAAALARANQDGFKERPLTPANALLWQPTPAGFAPALDPGWGGLLHYVPEAQFCRAGAPAADQLGQNKALFELSKTLTDDQKVAARFWDDERLRTTTPVGHWQNIATAEFTKRLELKQVTVEQAVRTLARLHLSLADTLIAVWRDKYTYGTARPITVLQQVEPGWNSYLGNPPFPAYPSGHAAVSAMSAELLTDVFGQQEFTDNGAFENPAGMRAFNIKPRSFPSYYAAGVEGGLSRIWGGIHVMDDYEGGRRIGMCINALWSK